MSQHLSRTQLVFVVESVMTGAVKSATESVSQADHEAPNRVGCELITRIVGEAQRTVRITLTELFNTLGYIDPALPHTYLYEYVGKFDDFMNTRLFKAFLPQGGEGYYPFMWPVAQALVDKMIPPPEQSNPHPQRERCVWKVNDEEGVQQEGVVIHGGLLAHWPEYGPGYEIVLTNLAEDRRVETVRADGEGANPNRWWELRDRMPDDAICFQPKSWADASIKEVYRNFEVARNLHPAEEIVATGGEEIQDPVFLDIEGRVPKLYWS